MKKNLKIMVVSSKGGVGKSTVSMQLLTPYLFEYNNKKAISYYEFDDENNDCLSYGDSKLTKREIVEVSSSILRDKITEIISKDETACFDVGGNKTTTMVLDAMAESGMVYFIDLVVIPLLDGEQDGINASVIYSIIKGINPEQKILFVLNRAKNTKYLHYQFDNFFGDVRGIFKDTYSIKNYLFDDDHQQYIAMIDDDIIKYSRRFGLTIYELAQKKQDFKKLLKQKKGDISHEQEVKLHSFKNYIQKASSSYFKDVLQPSYEKIDLILEQENDNKTT